MSLLLFLKQKYVNNTILIITKELDKYKHILYLPNKHYKGCDNLLYLSKHKLLIYTNYYILVYINILWHIIIHMFCLIRIIIYPQNKKN